MKKIYIFLFALILQGGILKAQGIDQYLSYWFKFDGQVEYSNTTTNIAWGYDRFGEINNTSLSLVGTNHYYWGGSRIIPSGNMNLTISVWIKPNDLSGVLYSQSHKYIAGSFINSIYLGIMNGAIVYSPWVTSFVNDSIMTKPNIIKSNKWQHLVLTHINDKVEIYVDGIKILDRTDVKLNQTQTTTNVNTNSAIGSKDGISTVINLKQYEGSVDNLMFFNKAFSSSEAIELNTVNINSNGNCVSLTPDTNNINSFVWSTGETTPAINACYSDQYSVTVTNSTGTSSILRYNVDISNINDSLWTPDAPVKAIYRKNDVIYLGGEFQNFRQISGCAALINNVTGKFDYSMPKIYGLVNSIISDGNGGWYIGGSFQKIGSYYINNLAHINPDKSVDAAFQPNPNDTVYSLAKSNNKLYVGGAFTKIGNISMNYLAAFNLTNNQTSLWNPNPNTRVKSIAIYNENLYASGDFTSIGTLYRNYLAALDTVYAQATSWNPNPDNKINRIVLVGNKLYVAGSFTSIDGSSKNYLCYFQNNVLSTWSPNPNGKVHDIIEVGNNIFVGGDFTAIGGVNRNYLAAFSKTTGILTSWNPVVNGSVYALTVYNNSLICGGVFQTINSTPRNLIASIDITTGQLTSWNPDIRGLNNTSAFVKTLICFNSNVYAGGNFASVGNISRNYLAALDANSGSLLSWDPNPNNIVNTIYATNSNVYIGGNFTSLNSGANPKNYIAMLSSTTGLPTGWNPNSNGEVYKIDVKGNYMYVSGNFTNIGNRTNNFLAQLDIAYGASTTWNFNMNGKVYDLCINTDTLYIGGAFTSASSQTRNRVCSFNTLTQTITALNPNCNDTVYSVENRGSILYIGGKFTQANSQTRNRFASWDIFLNTLAPLTMNISNKQIECMASSPSALYLGGSFSTIQTINSTAYNILDNITNTEWCPAPNDAVKTIFVYQDKVYLGGKFTYASGVFQPYFTCVNNLSTINAQITPPFATTFCSGTIGLAANLTPNYKYQWFYNNSPINGAMADTYFPTQSGTYNVLITDTINYGTSYSNGQNVTVIQAPDTIISVTGNQNFCVTGSATLQAATGSGNTYQWYKNNSIISGQTNSSYTATTTGQYHCVITNSSSCESTSQKININATSISPVITNSSGITTICSGNSVALSSDHTSGNLWYKDGISTGITTQNFSATQSGTYKCFVTDGSCTGYSQEIIITVNSLPATPTITPSGATTFCQGNSVILSAPAGYSYLWSNSATTQTIAANTTGNYSVQITDANNCTSTNSSLIAITVNPLPATPTITPSGTTTFCQGNSVTLNAPTGFTYLWSNSATTQSISATTAGNYTLQVINGNNCTSPNSVPVAITVNPLPSTPVITPSGATTFCQGGNVVLNAPVGYTYLWSNNATTQSISINANGSFTVQVTDGNSCTSLASSPVVVTVNNLPSTPVISASGSTNICQGSSVLLSAPVGYTYVWSTSATTQSINASTSGSYTVQIIDANNCTSANSVPVAVTVNSLPPTPTIIPSGTTTFCQGNNVSLNAPNGYTYLWSNSATTQSISVNSAGSYTLQVIDGNNCHSLSSVPVIVTVNSLPATPTITYTGSTNLCQGSSITLNAPAGYYYNWSTSATSQNISVNYSGSFTVQVTNGNNCTSLSSNAVSVTVNPLPSTPTISVGGATNFCEGNSVTLSAPIGFSTYNWSNGLHTQSITATTAGAYTVQVLDNNNCSSNNSIPITITVNSLPATPTITANGQTTFCQGNNVTLNAPAGFTYLWSNSATTQNISVSINGTYTVLVTDGNSCQSQPSNGITITVNPLPTTPVITQNGHTLSSNATIGNQWYNSTGAIGGAAAQNYTATSDGNYYVIVTANGCSSLQSNSINVIGTEIEQANTMNFEFEIYPNPVKNELTIETKSIIKQKFEITNIIGQSVYNSTIDKKAIVDMSNFKSGIYLLKLFSEKSTSIKKFVKE